MRSSIDSFIQYMSQVKQASDNTLRAYRNDIKAFADYLEEQSVLDWNRVTETRVKSYLLYLKKSGKSTATIARSLATIKKLVYYLVCNRIMDHDPTERIHPPKVEKVTPEAITRQQMNQLLQQPDAIDFKGKRDRAILELLYATGMKATELITIKVEDVNLRFGCITLHAKDKERILPISKTAKEALDRYIREMKRIECRQPFLFCNRKHEQLTRQGVWKMVKEYAKQAGIEENLSLQIIRNSFAAHMIENGADLRSMQELLGVSDISLTQKYVKSVEGEAFKTYQRTHPKQI